MKRFWQVSAASVGLVAAWVRAGGDDVTRRNRIDWLWTALLAVILAAPLATAWVLAVVGDG